MDNLDTLLEPKIHAFKVISKLNEGDRVCTSSQEVVTIDHATNWLPWFMPDIIQAYRRKFITCDSREKAKHVFKNLIKETIILSDAMLSYIVIIDTKPNSLSTEINTYQKYFIKLNTLCQTFEQSTLGFAKIAKHPKYTTDANTVSDIEVFIDDLTKHRKKIINTLKSLKNFVPDDGLVYVYKPEPIPVLQPTNYISPQSNIQPQLPLQQVLSTPSQSSVDPFSANDDTDDDRY